MVSFGDVITKKYDNSAFPKYNSEELNDPTRGGTYDLHPITGKWVPKEQVEKYKVGDTNHTVGVSDFNEDPRNIAVWDNNGEIAYYVSDTDIPPQGYTTTPPGFPEPPNENAGSTWWRGKPMTAAFDPINGVSDYWANKGKMDPTTTLHQDVNRRFMTESRARQQEGLDLMQQYATGEKSASGEAMRRAIEQQQQAFAAQAKSARSPAEARAAMYQQAAVQQGSASTGAQAAIEEQLGASKDYLNALYGSRAQDIATFGAETQAKQQQAAENEMIKNMEAKYMLMGMSQDEANRQAQIDLYKFLESIHQQEENRAAGITQSGNALNAQQSSNTTSAVVGGMATALPIILSILWKSDKRVKKNIKKGKTKEFLDKLNDYEYEYIDEKDGQGKYLGILAQDMEKSEVGKSFVKEINGVKMIDSSPQRFDSAILASLANLNKRLNKVEK